MQSPHVELPCFVLCLDELPTFDQALYDRPVSPCLRQEVAHGLFPHGMHSSDTQQIFNDVARKSEGIALVSYEIFHVINPLMEDMINGILFIPRLLPKRLDGTGPKAIILSTSLNYLDYHLLGSLSSFPCITVSNSS